MSFGAERYRGRAGDVLDHLCPICDGEGGRSYECPCNGLGVVTAGLAAALVIPGESPTRLPAPPAEMPRRCHDCAFRPDSPEHDNFAAMVGILEMVVEDQPFFCHQGMHVTADGRYIPQRTDARGVPVGHPICAGWAAARAKLERKETTE